MYVKSVTILHKMVECYTQSREGDVKIPQAHGQ